MTWFSNVSISTPSTASTDSTDPTAVPSTPTATGASAQPDDTRWVPRARVGGRWVDRIGRASGATPQEMRG